MALDYSPTMLQTLSMSEIDNGRYCVMVRSNLDGAVVSVNWFIDPINAERMYKREIAAKEDDSYVVELLFLMAQC